MGFFLPVFVAFSALAETMSWPTLLVPSMVYTLLMAGIVGLSIISITLQSRPGLAGLGICLGILWSLANIGSIKAAEQPCKVQLLHPLSMPPRGLVSCASHQTAWLVLPASLVEYVKVNCRQSRGRSRQCRAKSTMSWGERPTLAKVWQNLGLWVSAKIQQIGMDPNLKRFYLAVVFGKSAVDRKIYQNFLSLGLLHVLVISGLHLALLFKLILYLGQLIPRAAYLISLVDYPCFALLQRIAVVLSLSLCGGFAMITGFQPPVQRALCLISVQSLSRLAGWHLSVAYRYQLAMALQIAISPWTFLSVSNALSWTAYLLVSSLSRGNNDEGWPVLKVLRLHVELGLLSLLFFTSYSAYGILVNFLLSPLIGIFICSVFAGMLLSNWSLTSYLFQLQGLVLGWVLQFAADLDQKLIYYSGSYFAKGLILLYLTLRIRAIIEGSKQSWRVS